MKFVILSVRQKSNIKNHVKSHNADGDWKCHSCNFETNSKEILNTHKCKEEEICHISCETETKNQNHTKIHNTNHELRKSPTGNILKNIKCNVCEDMFSNKTELSSHKLKGHKSWKLCNKFFSSDVNVKCLHNPCHFSHVPPSEGMHRCYDCGREFMVLEELMLHRKAIHNAVCRLSLTNQCERDQETCWFNHPPHKNTVAAQGVENSVIPKQSSNKTWWGVTRRIFRKTPK